MPTQPIIAYYRVSTQKRAKSGLGLTAQQEAVERFTTANGFTIAATFTEVETGKEPMPSTAGRNSPPR